MSDFAAEASALLAAASDENAVRADPLALAASHAQLAWLLSLHHTLLPALHRLRERHTGERLAAQADPDAALDVEVGRWLQSLRNVLGHLYELPIGLGLSADSRDALSWTLRLRSQLKVGLAEAPHAAALGGLGAAELVDALGRLDVALQRTGHPADAASRGQLAATRAAVHAACECGWSVATYGAQRTAVLQAIDALTARSTRLG